MVFEKDGSFINQSFRIQRFKAAIPGPRGVQSDFTILDKIAAALAEEKSQQSPSTQSGSAWWRQLISLVTPRWSTLPEKVSSRCYRFP